MILAHAVLLAATVMAAPVKTDPAVVGVGIEIKIDNGYPVIVSLVPGGPAGKDGQLSIGDRIEGVAQGDEPWKSTYGLKLIDVVTLVRGKCGTKVSVRATRMTDDGSRQQLIVELTRDALKTPPKKSTNWISSPSTSRRQTKGPTRPAR